jgi:hypothetical protein
MWVSHLYQKSATDGVLFNQRDDFGELINVNPSTGASKHIVLYAPLKLIKKRKEQLINKGYFMQDSINLNLKGLAAV